MYLQTHRNICMEQTFKIPTIFILTRCNQFLPCVKLHRVSFAHVIRPDMANLGLPDSKVPGPTWGPSGADRTQVGPMLAPWTLLSGLLTVAPLGSILHTSKYLAYLGRDKWSPFCSGHFWFQFRQWKTFRLKYQRNLSVRFKLTNS